MTIIHPQKQNKKAKLYISSLVFLAVIVSVSGVFIYNLSVNYRHEIANQKAQLRDAEVKNAELKAGDFSSIDGQNMESLAATAGLVLEKNPQFIKIPRLASSR